ncbi:uncharacterized protein VTP21DRAFT_3471 [Calcarisporiella thermophila]|uniref:uncharacterized protein n=1 Tax=Calcarisporiella thermophila TaxID=911321 RepID=UPI00374485D3
MEVKPLHNELDLERVSKMDKRLLARLPTVLLRDLDPLLHRKRRSSQVEPIPLRPCTSHEDGNFIEQQQFENHQEVDRTAIADGKETLSKFFSQWFSQYFFGVVTQLFKPRNLNEPLMSNGQMQLEELHLKKPEQQEQDEHIPLADSSLSEPNGTISSTSIRTVDMLASQMISSMREDEPISLDKYEDDEREDSGIEMENYSGHDLELEGVNGDEY